jgi:hypothetical protein
MDFPRLSSALAQPDVRGEREGAADRQRRRNAAPSLRLYAAHWLERATKARDRIVAMYDERFFRMWEFYLAGGIVMFESGAACNYQVQYIRDRNAVPITRDYLAEAESGTGVPIPPLPRPPDYLPLSSATRFGAG